ncbi:MAG: Fatty acid-binding protein [Firmicutes bacterium ADurb.Bin182]|nr:MAG: Fatty acid-binding protein [Firmicutes bacterium ADurb.Bin182]
MIAIVTDSTACMTSRDAQKLDIHYVPMTYTIDGRSYSEKFIDMCGDYERLIFKANILRTSQANTHSIMKTFYKLRQSGYEILFLSISSKLSGTFGNALNCARELDESAIKVIDTKTTAGGLHILAKEARRLVNEGNTLAQTVKEILEMRSKIKIAFSVSDMIPLRHSGRLGHVRLSVSTILNRKPILICKEGQITSVNLVRGNRERIIELVNEVPEDAKDIIVHHIEAEEDANALAAELKEKSGREVMIRKASPSLCIHLGADVVGVVFRS